MNFKIKQPRTPPTRIALLLRWSQYFFFVVGALALGYVGFVLLDTSLFQAYQTWRFERALKSAQRSARTIQQSASTSLAAQAEADRARAESFGIDGLVGSPLGRIEISSIGLAAMIMEGTDRKTLRRAVGHISGTPLPGQPGNVVITGHRDTFFRGLRNIHKDDEITLTTLNGTYPYRVDFTKVVEPQDVAVLDHSEDAILTLVTCYPFYYVGPAPKRFIVRAHRYPPERRAGSAPPPSRPSV
jgi:sortase A